MSVYISTSERQPIWQSLLWVAASVATALSVWSINHNVGGGWALIDAIIYVGAVASILIATARHIAFLVGDRIPIGLSRSQVEGALRQYEAAIQKKQQALRAMPVEMEPDYPTALPAPNAAAVRSLAEQISSLPPRPLRQPPAPMPKPPQPVRYTLDEAQLRSIVMAELKKARQSEQEEKWNDE